MYHKFNRNCLTFVAFIAVLSCYCYSENIRAFSLREADKLLQKDAGNQELQNLGGITRFVGMVYDRENKDIILVGIMRDDLPAITIDDLAVALRCRLLADKYPCVSIDMTEETDKTGMQDVRFVGGIEQTQFGSDFLLSDVILKKYSLDLLESIGGVVPYLKQYEADVINTMEINGKSVEEVKWYNEADSSEKVEEYKGKDSLPGKTSQSRFWFHVIEDESGIVEQDDVYVIEELRLGVKAETLGSVGNDDKDIQAADISAEEFSRQFSTSYNEVCQANPLLKRLKAMFDLVCIAEGVAHLGNDRPDLNYLLGQYTVTTARTPEKYKLIHRVGEFKCEDGDVVLSQLSGGITLEAVLMALEDGDVSGLKIAVLGSRPDKESLYWDLPLDQWKMPNNQPQEQQFSSSTQPQKLDVEFPGFSMLAQHFYFPKDKTGLETTEFSGFKSPAKVPPLQQANPQLQKHKRLTISSDNAKLQKALLAEDWEKVVDLLQNVTIKTPDPVLRFIKAHACLATNRNNESVGLFSVATFEDLDKWMPWCLNLAEQQQNAALANYFIGDIYGKVGDYEKAIEHFNLSIQENNSILARNARGTVYIILGEYDKAASDLLKVKNAKPDFADVYNNLAMMNIRQKKGLIRNSKNRFQEVLDVVNPDFALARHGLGCMELLESPTIAEPDENKNLQTALEQLPGTFSLLIDNESQYTSAAINKQANALYANAGDEGTSMQKQFRLIGTIEEVDKAQIQYDSCPFWEKGAAQQRLDRAKINVGVAVQDMSIDEIKGTSQNVQTRTVEITDSFCSDLAKAKSTSNTMSKVLDAQSRALKYLSKVIPSKTTETKILKSTVSGAGEISKVNANEYRETSTMIDPMLHTASEWNNKARTATGTQHFGIPDQTQDAFARRAIERTEISVKQGTYTPAASPAGYAESLGVQKNYAGARYGGATTDKTLITWNDGEWPFDPVFGLLYPVPQNPKSIITDEANEEEK